MAEKAVILLSGGLDSTTCMAIAKDKGYELYPISFNYHQRHLIELESAKKIAAFYGVKEHLIIETNMDAIGGSALTDMAIDVPVGDTESKVIPPTYVPARNVIFLSYAIGYAEVIKAPHVYIGVNSVDYSNYPDCRAEFITAFQNVTNIATAATADNGQTIKLETPLQNLSKAEIVKLGTSLKAPYHLTRSCYRGGEKSCGICDSCRLRLAGFAAAGLIDPIEYAVRS